MSQRNTDWQSLSNQQSDALTARAKPRTTPTRQVAMASNRVANRKAEQATGDFWNRHPSGLDPVLTADQKDWLAADQSVFTVTGVRLQNSGNYGPTWWVTVEINGQRFGAPFQNNDVREAFYADLQTHVNEYGPIPVSLRAYDTTMGRGYDLCAPYDDTTDTEPTREPVADGEPSF